MIKLKSLIKEQREIDLGPIKVTVQMVDLFFRLIQKADGTILAFPEKQTRLFKSLDKFGFDATVSPLLAIINNKFGKDKVYTKPSNVEMGEPLVFNCQ